MHFKIKIFILAFILSLFYSFTFIARATNCPTTDYDCQIAEIQREIDALKPAHEQNKQELANLNTQIRNLNGRITAISGQLNSVQLSIAQREEDLAFAQIVFEEKANNHYKFIRLYDPIAPFFFSNDASEAFREIIFRQKAADEDIKTMEQYVAELYQLKTDKESFEKNKASLASAKANLDAQAKFLGAEIEKVEAHLATLSSRQQEIIDLRSGSFTYTLGSGELADEYLSSARGFQESAPSGYFAVFSFGGYSHRMGMSQYGARGRAQAGQNYTQILKTYYGKEPVSKDTGGNIKVIGYPDMDFETSYLYGIAEMPSSWHVEALKAQAVAARTYAYRYKSEGKEICTTQACQVFNKSKSDNPPPAWKEAVDQTRGQVLEDVVTYYSSTSGGFLRTMGWDTTDGSGGSNFIEKTYEKLGGSPWLEKAWWREGYSNSSSTCGRSNPWLSPEEMADIVNAHIVLTKGSSEEASRISPVTTACWSGNPYSMAELRNIASKYGGISSATSVSVSQGNGVTNAISINGIGINPSDFRRAFNLRAPGLLRIPQYPRTYGSPFFNIVKK